MKYSILIILFIFNTQYLRSQCTTKVDDMTKVKKTESLQVNIGASKMCKSCPKESLKISIMKLERNGKESFSIFFDADYTDVWSIREGDNIYIKTANDSVFIIPYVGDFRVSNYYRPGFNSLLFYQTFTREQLEYFYLNKIIKIRIKSNDYEIKNPEDISDQIDCVLKSKQ